MNVHPPNILSRPFEHCAQARFQNIEDVVPAETPKYSMKQERPVKIVSSDSLFLSSQASSLRVQVASCEAKRLLVTTTSIIADVVSRDSNQSIAVTLVEGGIQLFRLTHVDAQNKNKPKVVENVTITIKNLPLPVCAVIDHDHVIFAYQQGYFFKVDHQAAFQAGDLCVLPNQKEPLPSYIVYQSYKMAPVDMALHNGHLVILSDTSLGIASWQGRELKINQHRPLANGQSVGFVNPGTIGVTQQNQLVLISMETLEFGFVKLPSDDYVIKGSANSFIVLSNASTFILAKVDGVHRSQCISVHASPQHGCAASNVIVSGSDVSVFLGYFLTSVDNGKETSQYVLTKFTMHSSVFDSPQLSHGKGSEQTIRTNENANPGASPLPFPNITPVPSPNPKSESPKYVLYKSSGDALLKDLYEGSILADQQIVHDNVTLDVHRNVVSMRSAYFRSKFNSNDHEQAETTLDLTKELPVDSTYLVDVVKSLYCFDVELTSQNCYQIFYLARFFGIQGLHNFALEELKRNQCKASYMLPMIVEAEERNDSAIYRALCSNASEDQNQHCFSQILHQVEGILDNPPLLVTAATCKKLSIASQTSPDITLWVARTLVHSYQHKKDGLWSSSSFSECLDLLNLDMLKPQQWFDEIARPLIDRKDLAEVLTPWVTYKVASRMRESMN
ncbi:hypothetical protein P9112_003834 [Eukaryota sp. TZLM1-RC]